MKVTFKNNVKAYSGSIDGTTFSTLNHGDLCYMKKYTVPKLTVQNTLLGNIFKNLANIWHEIADGYKSDFGLYALRYTSQHIPNDQFPWHSYTCYIRMMFQAKTQNPALDLTTLTLAQIISQNIPIQTVAAAIEAGLLDTVAPYADLDKPIN